jgi:predicted short-subunit dehydrogenase-like oxidoreductase (DUF2520 family)
MDVVLIGAGRVAGAFAPFLKQLGTLRVWNRTLEHAVTLAQTVQCNVIENADDVNGYLAFVSVTDSALSDVAKTFKGRFTVAIHTSGFHSSSILNVMADSVGSLHPWLPITSQDRSLLHDAIATFEGDQAALDVASDLARLIPLRLFTIESDKKVLYHTAAVLLSNYVDALMIKGGEMLNEVGLKEDEREIFVKEIVSTTIDNYIKMGKESLTGPAVRKDLKVVEAEAAALKGDWSIVYTLLANIIMKGDV